MTRILITGAGLLGSEVANTLARDHAITVFDCDGGSRSRLAPTIRFEEGCITDREAVTRLLATLRPDAIVHTAAMLGPSFKADPVRGRRVNVAATLALARSALALGVHKFIQASSLAVYDFSNPEGPLDEDAGKTSDDLYGLAKLFTERALQRQVAHGLCPVILRFSGLYGAEPPDGGGWSARRLWTIARAVARKEPVTLDGDSFGDNEYLHVRDAARAVTLALGHSQPLLCNIGSGVITRFDRLTDAFRRCAPTARFCSTTRTNKAPDYLRRRRPLAIECARDRLGYMPSMSIEEGIAEIVAAACHSEGQASRIGS